MLREYLREIKHKFRESMQFFRRTIFRRICHIHLEYGKNVSIGKNVNISSYTRIYNQYKGHVYIGDNSHICCYCKFILALKGGGKLHIGKNVTLGEYNVINVFSDVLIGDDVVTADRVSFITNRHTYSDIHIPIKQQGGDSEEIIIGSGCWFGINAVVLAGTRIGKNCVIGANSVVKGNFPDYCVIAGSPGRIVKIYHAEAKEWVIVNN